MKSFRISFALFALVCALGMSASGSQAASLQSHAAIIKTFDRISRSPYLANPSIILMDRSSGEIIYEKDGTTARKPASVLKLFSAAVALQYIDPDTRFVTKLSLSSNPRTLVLAGDFDPWMASRRIDAVTDGRASLSYLGNRAIEKVTSLENAAPRTLVVKYSGVYMNDVRALAKYFKSRGVKATFVPVNNDDASLNSIERIATVTSPPLRNMVEFALLWSDNVLANRLALAASNAMGYTRDEAGVAEAFSTFLQDMQISTAGLTVRDGSGLSKKNRVTVEMVADLLMKIRGKEDFAPIYSGLPVSGISGTLEDRYLTTAPQAVGLVHAKTGTLDGTVSLAGYIDAGKREYVFVAIADRIRVGVGPTDRARATIDRLVGQIASPALPAA